jgi:hypothetical protein
MKTNEIIRLDEMSVGAGGVKYEAVVVNAISQAAKKFKGHVKIKDDNLTSAGYSNVGVDLEVEVAGKNFAVEIKQNKDAQMGSTSVRYNLETDEIYLVKPDDVDEEVQQLFIDATRSKKNDFIKFIKRVKQLTPQSYKQKIKTTVPFGPLWLDAWRQAQKEGLLKQLNGKIRFDNTDFIAKRYNRKGVYYIQIGGAGLFYLFSNPLKLPVPKFEGEIDIELRLKLGGSGGKPKASPTYSVSGRLKTTIESPLSLDNPADVATVFQTIINGGAKTTAPIKAKAAPLPAAKATKKSTAAPDLKAVKSVGTIPKVDPKQKAKAALASGGKSKKG